MGQNEVRDMWEDLENTEYQLWWYYNRPDMKYVQEWFIDYLGEYL